MRGRQIAVTLLALSLGEARAAEVSVYSTTLIGGRPDVVDGQVRTVVPLYELVGVRAKNLELKGFDELSVAVDAWGGLTLPNSPSGIGASDVNLAYVEARALKKKLRLRLGRQFVTGGVARAMFFDGLFADYRTGVGVGLSAFAGIPVERRFANFLRGDFVVGTRAYFQPSYTTEVGVSFIHMLQRGALSRQDAGLDGRWRIHRTISLAGAFVWSVAEGELAELDIGPRWTPTENVEVLFNYRRTAPELFLPRTSIFTVFADTSRDDAGVSVTWQLGSMVSAFGDFRALWISGEQGFEASARVSVRPFRGPSTTLVAQYHRLELPSNGYHQARVGARHVLPFGLGLAVDLETYVLDRAVREQTLSFSASTTATYAINKSWLVGATLFAATTPTFESRYEAIAKLSWIFPAGGSL
jgi:hypothetical protein